MLVRGTQLGYGVELGMEAFVAPPDFDPKAQELNLYAVFSKYYQTNSDAAFGYTFTSAIATLTLSAVANRSYLWGETLADGTEFVSNQILSGTAFTARTSKRFVIVFDSSASGSLSVAAPSGATWMYIRKGSTLTSLSTTYLKYIHFNNLNTLTTINTNCCLNNTGLIGDLYIPDSVTTIGNYAFSGCTGMTGNLRMSNRQTLLAQSTFNGCRFKTFQMGQAFTDMYNTAFQGWTHITTQDIIIPATMGLLRQTCFYNSTGFRGGVTILSPGIIINAVNSAYHPFQGCTGITALNLPLGYLGRTADTNNPNWGKTWNFSNNFSAASLNQSILNLPDNFGSFIIGTTNKTRLTNAFPSAVTDAAARGITIT